MRFSRRCRQTAKRAVSEYERIASRCWHGRRSLPVNFNWLQVELAELFLKLWEHQWLLTAEHLPKNYSVIGSFTPTKAHLIAVKLSPVGFCLSNPTKPCSSPLSSHAVRSELIKIVRRILLFPRSQFLFSPLPRQWARAIKRNYFS